MPKDLFSPSSPVLGEPRALDMPTAQSYSEATACFLLCRGGGVWKTGSCCIAQASSKLSHLSCLGFLLAGVTGVPSFPADFFFFFNSSNSHRDLCFK